MPTGKTTRTSKHRALMLHGRAAEGAFLERLLTAFGWAALPIDFTIVTALHACTPSPELYPSTVTFPNGTFDWGFTFDEPDRATRIRQSVEDIERILTTDRVGFDGIGGICDGSLIANLVAARLPATSRVCFTINMCGGPWEMLPETLKMEKPVTLPSIHLIGKKDEFFS